MSVELKIKAKHLALEPAIIGTEIKKLAKQLKFYQQTQQRTQAQQVRQQIDSLAHHRNDRAHNGLKTEARATHLARAFLAGKDYKDVEQSRRPDVEWYFNTIVIGRIAKMVQKYGKDYRNHTVDQVEAEIRQWIFSEK